MAAGQPQMFPQPMTQQLALNSLAAAGTNQQQPMLLPPTAATQCGTNLVPMQGQQQQGVVGANNQLAVVNTFPQGGGQQNMPVQIPNIGYQHQISAGQLQQPMTASQSQAQPLIGQSQAQPSAVQPQVRVAKANSLGCRNSVLKNS